MQNSWASTRKYMWVIPGGYTIITIVLYVPLYFVSSLFEETSISSWVFDTASNMVYSVSYVLYTTFAISSLCISRRTT